MQARGSKLKAQCYNKVVCPNYMHPAYNSTYFAKAAAVPTKRKKYAIDCKMQGWSPLTLRRMLLSIAA